MPVCKVCGKEGVKFYKRNGTTCTKCRTKMKMLSGMELKRLGVEYLGGKCSKCGFHGNHGSLQFHHIDPNSKDKHYYEMRMRITWEEYKKELDKCVLLCSNCHAEEHKSNRYEEVKATYNSEKRYKFTENPENCSICGKIENRIVENNLICKKCRTNIQIFRIISAKIKGVEYLGGKCSVCGYDKYYGALHFHHIDPTTKSEKFRSIRTSTNWERLKEELNKCVLLCANCHAETHETDLYKRLKEFEPIYRLAVAEGRGYRTEEEKLAKREIQICEYCKKEFRLAFPSTRKHRFCSRECMSMGTRKYERPSKDQLAEMLKTMSYDKVGKVFGCNGKLVRKWEELYNKPK